MTTDRLSITIDGESLVFLRQAADKLGVPETKALGYGIAVLYQYANRANPDDKILIGSAELLIG